MIEQPQVPGDRVVAGLAVSLKDAFVVVVFQVAIDALVIGVCKELRLMAVFALNVSVFTQKREIC